MSYRIVERVKSDGSKLYVIQNNTVLGINTPFWFDQRYQSRSDGPTIAAFYDFDAARIYLNEILAEYVSEQVIYEVKT